MLQDPSAARRVYHATLCCSAYPSLMLIVHQELLADSYLLVLAPDPANPSEIELAQQLSCAVRSGKPAVWVDCRLLHTMSATAVRLLCACHFRLRQRGAQLVLCRVSAALAQVLHQLCAGPEPAWQLVDSLDEAAGHLSFRTPEQPAEPNPDHQQPKHFPVQHG